MNRKSISPLIATFILISLTVAVGAMIVAWGRSYVQKQMECVRLGASLSLISPNFTTNPQIIRLRLYNTGEVALKKEDLLFKVITVEGAWDDCFIVGGCVFEGFNILNQKGMVDITIYVYNLSSVYNKSISKIELYHRPCDQLIAYVSI